LLKNLFRKEETIIKNVFSSNIKENYDLIIHIGAPKTGSSALQKFLLENRKILENEGYFYPVHGLDKNGISGGHSILAIALLENRIEDAKEIYINWENEARANKKILFLSSESFFNLSDKLKNIIDDKRVLIISYQRDIVEYLVSVHNQLIKRHFSTVRFEEYIDSLLKDRNSIGNLVNKSFSKIYDEWAKNIGFENMIVKNYDSKLFFMNRIELDLLSILNIDYSKFKFKDKLINISYTNDTLELKRMINYILDRENTKVNHKIDVALQHYSELNFRKSKKQIPLTEASLKKLKGFILEDEKTVNNKYLKMENKQKNYSLANNSIKNEELKKILSYLQKDNEVKEYLIYQMKKKLESKNNLQYSIFKLAELFDIPNLVQYEENQNEVWFTQNQLTNMANGKYQEADFLRDIAILLKNKDDTKNAKDIINKAYKLRPHGAYIQKLKEEMDELI
jgi:hypothetical protein